VWRLVLLLAPAAMLCAGCASPKLGPKFAQVRDGLSREEVLTIMGSPDSRGEVGTSAIVEQWEYSDDYYTYLVRFGPKKDEPREQWRVVGKQTTPGRSVSAAFAKVTNGMTREEVSGLLGECTAPLSKQAPEPGEPCEDHYAALQALLKGGRYEEWAYADAGQTYLVWFGTTTDEAREDWSVIGKSSYAGGWNSTDEPMAPPTQRRSKRTAPVDATVAD